jgi:urea transport system permease protein
VIGALLVNFAKSWFTAEFPEFWLFVLGAMFVLSTLWLPRGVMGGITGTINRLFGRGKPQGTSEGVS